MSIAFKSFKVEIEEMEGDRAPMPKPLSSGFSLDNVYDVLGVYNPSETADCYLLLVNDRRELWWLSTRHLRYVE